MAYSTHSYEGKEYRFQPPLQSDDAELIPALVDNSLIQKGDSTASDLRPYIEEQLTALFKALPYHTPTELATMLASLTTRVVTVVE